MLLLRHFRPAGKPPLAARPVGAVVYGVWLHAGTAESGTEDVVVLRLGPEEFEVHIHGGRQSRQSLRQILIAAGFVEQSAPDWLRSRCASGLAAVVQEQLLRCETERAARWLLDQELAWQEWIEAVERKLVSKDFSAVGAACAAVLQREKLAVHLTEPWKVVLGGEPNVGKSSLINALAGFSRAIVHDSPGTTRDVVTQRLVMDGWLVELADTAGQRVASSAIEASGIERALEIWRTADCRVAVTDATRPLEASQIDWQPPPQVLVANKADLPEARWGGNFLSVSALSQTGLEQLQAAILHVLVPEVTAATQPLPLGGELPRLVEHLSRAAAASDAARLADGLRRIREYCGLPPCANG